MQPRRELVPDFTELVGVDDLVDRQRRIRPPVDDDRNVVVVSARRGQLGECRVRDIVDGEVHRAGHRRAEVFDPVVERYVAPLDQAVGVEHQRRARRQSYRRLRTRILALHG